MNFDLFKLLWPYIVRPHHKCVNVKYIIIYILYIYIYFFLMVVEVTVRV